MEQNQITEYNGIIAKFMGAVTEQWYPASEMYNQSGIHYVFPKEGMFPDNVRHHHEESLKYHSSWDWLMPVVEKISKLRIKYLNVDEYYNPYPVTFGMIDEEGNYMVRIHSNPLFSASTLIEAAWLAITNFIKEYNDGTKNT